MWTKQSKGKFQGGLIDLDFMSGPEDHPTYNPNVVPFSFSIPFLALDLLGQDRHQPHMYHHDLESFLWTFIWLILGNKGVEMEEFSVVHLQEGSRKMVARAKRHFLTPKVCEE